MRKLLGLLVLLAGSTTVLSATGDTRCDRGCLQELIERYMRAVAANDVKAVPLMLGYRQTENTKVTRPGTGVWKTVTALGNQPNLYLDPVTGEALWFGTVETTLRKQPEVVMVRIKVIDREIAEAEWIMTGPGLASMRGPAQPDGTNEVFSDPAWLTANRPPTRVVPVAKRRSRVALEGIANSYFDGLTANDGSLVLAHPDCFRAENGRLMTGQPLEEGRTDGYQGRTNCTSGFDRLDISLVAQRRFFAIDETQQVVASAAVFLRKPNAAFRRCVFFEIFYIDEGRISQIYSVLYYPAPDEPVPNWPPYDGNFPLPASFGEAR
jgi:hypothetical protein